MALYRVAKEMSWRAGQAGGKVGRATGRGATKIYKATGRGAAKFGKGTAHFFKEFGKSQGRFWNRCYQRIAGSIQQRMRRRQSKPIHHRRYAPTHRRGRRH